MSRSRLCVYICLGERSGTICYYLGVAGGGKEGGEKRQKGRTEIGTAPVAAALCAAARGHRLRFGLGDKLARQGLTYLERVFAQICKYESYQLSLLLVSNDGVCEKKVQRRASNRPRR